MVPIVGGELPNRLTDELNGGTAYRSVFGGGIEGLAGVIPVSSDLNLLRPF